MMVMMCMVMIENIGGRLRHVQIQRNEKAKKGMRGTSGELMMVSIIIEVIEFNKSPKFN